MNLAMENVTKEGIRTQRMKYQILANGYRYENIEGEKEPQLLMTLPNVLMFGLECACDPNDGASGLRVSEMNREIVKQFTDDKHNLDILNETNNIELVYGMLTNPNIENQLLYATRFLELVSEKVKNHCENQENQVYDLFDKEIKSLEQELESKSTEIELANQRMKLAFERENKANEELSKVKRKADKQIRVLEHENEKLRQEIEKLRKQI